ncbi:MAG: 16S rRNA (guanine(966)-N(2))-methyltransferase RsmD [Terriglobales bacterium]
MPVVSYCDGRTIDFIYAFADNCQLKFMRVIAGQYRSRPLRALPGIDTRPTSDRLRETLFNVLTAGRPDALQDTVWLDVFAGTGAVGIEALSRGAGIVYFIESSRRAANLIRRNLKSLAVPNDNYQVIERDAAPALRALDSAAVACDYCFLDPPYGLESAYDDTLGFLSQSQLLRPASVVIAEHSKHFGPGERFGALQRYRTLPQGDAVLSFYQVS